MNTLSPFELYRATWQASKARPEVIKALQMERLNAVVQYARQHSRVYAERYQGLPERITDPRQLPIVSKAELMPRFEDWVTDPAVRRAELEDFIHDPNKIGQSYLGKYTVCTTSGTTMTLMGALNILRAMPAWINGGQLVKII